MLNNFTLSILCIAIQLLHLKQKTHTHALDLQ